MTAPVVDEKARKKIFRRIGNVLFQIAVIIILFFIGAGGR